MHKSLANLVASLGCPLILVDIADGTVIDANEAARRFFDLKRTPIRQIRIGQLFPEIKTVSMGTRPKPFEIRRRLANGGKGRWMVFVEPVQDANDSFELYLTLDFPLPEEYDVVIARPDLDVYDLAETSVTGIYVVQNGVLVYVNARIAEILGYESSSCLIGTPLLSLIADGDKKRATNHLQGLATDHGKSQPIEFDFVRRDGTVVPIGTHITVTTFRGMQSMVGLAQDISDKRNAAEQIERYIGQLTQSVANTMRVIAAMSGIRDPYTVGHEHRVAQIAVAIANEMGLASDRTENIRMGANLHDLGKIGIPAEILTQSRKLSKAEYGLIMEHPALGHAILKEIDFPESVKNIVLEHHERMDGRGYPQGLKGEAIQLESRIVAVADVIESMASDRPYRLGLGLDIALAELDNGNHIRYDNGVVAATMRLFRERGFDLPHPVNGR